MTTATFKDIYFGPTEMTVTPFKTHRRGTRVVRFRWSPVTGGGCITTGFHPGGFVSKVAAVEAATRHPLFSRVTT